MPQSIDEWSDQHWDRTFARQSTQVDTAKLLVTFTLGFTATIVATGLQVAPQSPWDVAAVIVLTVAFLATILTIAMDRLQWPKRRAALNKQADEGWSDAQLLVYVRGLLRDTEEENQLVVRRMSRVAEYQVVLAVAAAALAVVSLFTR